MTGLHFGRLSFLAAAARAMSLVVAFAYCSHVHCFCAPSAPGGCSSPCCSEGGEAPHEAAVTAPDGPGAGGSKCCTLEATTECGLVGRPEASSTIARSDVAVPAPDLFIPPSVATVSADASATGLTRLGAPSPASLVDLVPLGLRAPPTRPV